MNPSPEQNVERERRLAPWAAAAGLASLAALIGSMIIGGSSRLETDAERYRELAAGSVTGEVASAILAAIAFLLTAIPLAVLLQATRGRSPELRRGILALVIAGPILIAAQTILVAATIKGLSEDFVTAEAAAPAVDLVDGLDDIEEVVIYPDDDVVEVLTTDGGVAQVPLDEDAEELTTRLEGEGIDVSEEERGDPGDLLIQEVQRDSPVSAIAVGLSLGGFFALVVGGVYTFLNAMRVGLLTRFLGTLGMAMSVALLIIPAIQTIVIFELLVVAIGLLIWGKWPGGQPPAWQSGKAEPWPKPGDRLEGDEEDIAETPEEAFAGELEPEPGSEPASPAHPRSKKKRKRR